MSELLVCCAMYEKGRPFLMQWMQALAVATKGHDTSALVVTDDLKDAKRALNPLRKYLPIHVVHAARNSSIADVRRLMLRASADSNAEILCFIDMDDLFLPNALALHRQALADADFSYGNLLLIDEVGLPMGQSLFEGRNIPHRLNDVESILDRNFLGLSNTAVWRRALPDAALNVPPDIVAVDWWLFSTLLLHRRVGRRTRGPVCQYRTYGGNLIGGMPGLEAAAILRRCEMVLKHYDQFRHDLRFAQRATRVRWLRDRLVTKPGWITDFAARIQVGVWWEDIVRLAEHVWQDREQRAELAHVRRK